MLDFLKIVGLVSVLLVVTILICASILLSFALILCFSSYLGLNTIITTILCIFNFVLIVSIFVYSIMDKI